MASNLEIPWALDFAPDGRIFVTERPGRVRVIKDGRLQETPWAALPVANWRAAGLSGIALDPDFARNGFVYVVGTFRTGEDKFENRIYRFTDRKGRGVKPVVVVDKLPSIDTHAGGAFAFGPDGKLYLAVGDGERSEEVQDMQSTTGKILRYNPDGSIPGDNPFPGSPVYALGVRNPQGFAWHPESGDLFATEHGPSGFPEENGREDQDELNVILPRGNYGWPDVSGFGDEEKFISPLVDWTPAIAPSGLAVDTNEDSPWHANFFVGALRGQHIRRVVVERAADVGAGWRITHETPLFEKQFGRIRAVKFGPDGDLYFTTSNRNTPGEPIRKLAREGDDKVYRIPLPPLKNR
ncbi:MAG: PQQ-dependent sugar dehydrogenase [Gammaproteobacteria bacterium]|nr:PQQ-dependent sugar dehydrogenase [Gammaproteobacteria bacterium]